MNVEKYPVVADKNMENFDFISVGPKGIFHKKVAFQNLYYNFYNLLFGNWSNELRRIDDRARTNNQDRDKIMSTVAYTIFEFMRTHPDAIIEIKGSTEGRTRLYQIAIKKYYHHIIDKFIVEGFFEGHVESLKWRKNYDGFTIRHKK